MAELLDVLSGDEAFDVLRELLRSHPTLRAEADDIARDRLSAVDPLAVADAVRDRLHALDLEDLAARCGRRGGSYVEPAEAAWELVEEVVELQVQDIVRLVEAGVDEAARRRCEGLLLGLYSAREPMGHEVLSYCEDAPAELADWALRTWHKAGGPRRDTRHVGPDVLEELAEWAAFLERPH